MINKFSKEFFYDNRQRLCQILPNHLIVLPAHCAMQFSADMSYPFRQDSNFWYLTGINEPDILLVIDTYTGKSTILLPERNAYQNEWDGALDNNNLKSTSGVDEISFKADLTQLLKIALKNNQKIGYLPAPPDRIEPYGFYANPSRKLLELELLQVCNKDDLVDIKITIARLRQIKQPCELKAIRSAIDITGKSLKSVKSKLATYTTEKDIENDLTSHFYKYGGEGNAYEAIVASGPNAAVIHYTGNNQKLDENELLLLDVGSKVNGYAADISRTWSLNASKITPRQSALYEAALDIQEKGIALLHPGAMLKDVQKELDTYSQTVFKNLKCSMHKKPFPHGFSHFLGIDVHDAGDYTMPLESGMVLTMEPGIYLQDEGIGIRIEDDILITENGNENLSITIPKVLY